MSNEHTEAFSAFIPVLTAFAGWFISERTKSNDSKRKVKEDINQCIADLMDISFRMECYATLHEALIEKIYIPKNDMPQFKKLLFDLMPTDVDLPKRYSLSINQIARINPILGYRLKHLNLPEDMVKLFAGAQGIQINEIIQTNEDVFLAKMVSKQLNEIIPSIAWHSDFSTYLRARKWCKRKIDRTLPPEMMEALNRIAPAKSDSSPPSNPTQPVAPSVDESPNDLSSR